MRSKLLKLILERRVTEGSENMRGTMQLRKSAVLLGLLVATLFGGAFGWVGTALLNSRNSGPLVPLFLAGETPARAAEVSFLSGFTPIVK